MSASQILQDLKKEYGQVNFKGERFNALRDLSFEADLEREEAMREQNQIFLNNLKQYASN